MIFNTRLFISGQEVYLGDQFDGSMTYALDDVKDLTSKSSDYTKTITIPGSVKNNALFNYLYNIKSQNQPLQSGSINIGYNYDFTQRAPATIYQGGQVIFSGYARLISATNLNGLVNYEIQISSELTSFASILADNRLEALVTGSVSQSIQNLNAEMSLENIVATWTSFDNNPSTPQVFFPLIDYGNPAGAAGGSVNGTNFYIQNCRPCLSAKTYWDLIFDNAGYTYSSSFLTSDYFSRMIIPFSDGNLPDKVNPVTVTNTTASTYTLDNTRTPGSQSQDIYIFNNIISDPNNTYSSSLGFVAPTQGNYNVNVSLPFTIQFSPTSNVSVFNTDISMSVVLELYHGGVYSPFFGAIYQYVIPANTYQFNGNFTSSIVNATFPNMFARMQANDLLKVTFSPQAFNFDNYFTAVTGSYAVPGSGSITIQQYNGATPLLDINYSNVVDNSVLTFFDYVPKNIKQIDYITSIAKLFNLFIVQDPAIPQHFLIQTRDEFYLNSQIVDWSNKLDYSQQQKITPIPNLDNSQLLFSYREDGDWWNKQYSSLYTGIYGQKVLPTNYAFSVDELDVLDQCIFSPTVPVCYENEPITPESTCEILNSDLTSFYVTGYSQQQGGGSTSGGFLKARVGLFISYWGNLYEISGVGSNGVFSVSSPVSRPSGSEQPSGSFYALADTFYYISQNNKTIPVLADSSDNFATYAPVKCNPRILYYAGLRNCNQYVIQDTPQQNGNETFYLDDLPFSYQTVYPYCSHLDDDQTPTRDLLFDEPVNTFFPANFIYPTNNLYINFFRNQFQEVLDINAKMLTANFKLNSIDISNRDLSNTISVNGTNFRINKIMDYIPDNSKTTQIELVRLSDPVYQYAFLNETNNITGSTSYISLALSASLVSQITNPLTASGNSSNGTEFIGFFGDPTSFILSSSVSSSGVPYQLHFYQNGYQIFSEVVTGSFNTILYPVYVEQNDQILLTANNYTLPSYILVENFGYTSTINSASISGTQITNISGSLFPMHSSQSGKFDTNNLGLLTMSLNVNKSIFESITITDCIGTVQSIQFNSTISGSNVVFTNVSMSTNQQAKVVLNAPTSSANVEIINSIGTANITSVSGISGYSFVPILGPGTDFGYHAGFTSGITVITSGTIPVSPTFHCTLLVNSSIKQQFVASSGATYNFSSSIYASSDQLEITLST